jgi:hypothetical protein
MKKLSILLLVLSLTSSCVSSLNNNQKRRLSAAKMEFPDLYQEEKNIGISAILGILPGGGSFYTQNYGVGVVSLLLWPVSIAWDPINGINGAQELNYYSTLQNIKRRKSKEIQDLKLKYSKEHISNKEFNIQKMEIESKYNLDSLL